MGSIKNFNLETFINSFNLDTFIETGLGHGHGIQFAAGFKFNKLLSIEISPEVIKKYNENYAADSRIEIIWSNSQEGLKHLFESEKIAGNCFIFLDAHFPGFDVLGEDINGESKENIKYPLLSELEIIKEYRVKQGFKDCILIDDMMFYSTDEFPDSHLKTHFKIEPPADNNCLDKILSYFDETHNSGVIKKDSGYGIFVPKIK